MSDTASDASAEFLEAYTIEVDRDFGGKIIPIPICAVCGNTGKMWLAARRTPWGARLEPVVANCFCPNGRANEKSKL